jgi:hypothetical protein
MDGALFLLGRVVATPGALKATPPAVIIGCIRRHLHGDWGVVDAEDKATNDEAVCNGLRILSAYPIDPQRPCSGHGDNTLWIIDDSVKMILPMSLQEVAPGPRPRGLASSQ